jgi:hypothetical protein
VGDTKRGKKREKKKHSTPFSHEIESLSGMWGHVCLGGAVLVNTNYDGTFSYTEFDFSFIFNLNRVPGWQDN